MPTLIFALLIFEALSAITANILADYAQQVIDTHPKLSRLTSGNKLVLFTVVFLVFQIPACVLGAVLAVGAQPDGMPGLSASWVWWIPAVGFSLGAAYLTGRYWNSEVRPNAGSDGLDHLAVGLTFSVALVPLTVPAMALVFKVTDPLVILFYHSVTPPFVMACPAFIIIVFKYLCQVIVERFGEAAERRMAEYEGDARALGVDGDDEEDD